MTMNPVPRTNNTGSLGTSAKRWGNAYLGALDLVTLAVEGVTVDLAALTAFATNHNTASDAHDNLRGAASGIAELDAGGKVPTAQLPDSLVGAVSYQGVWNATTNSPAITSSVGIKGYYYKVSVAGTTSIDSIAVWDVGDWIVFNGTTWDKLDNTELVSSVAGRTGAIVIAQADVSGLTTADKPLFTGLALGSLASAQTNTIAYLNESFVTNSAQRSGIRNNVLLAPTADGTAEAFGFQSTPRTTTGNGYDIKRLVSFLGTLIHDGTGDITTGMHAFSHNQTITGTTSAGAVAEFCGFYSPAVALGAGSTATFPAVYGIKLDRQTIGATNYQLYSAGGASLLLAGDAAIVPLTLKLAASQSANALQVLSSAGGVLWSVDATGIVQAAGYKSSDGTAGGSTTTGGLTFKNGLYTSGTASGGGASAFTGLSDTFAAYTGHASKLLRVNAGETAVEPVAASALKLDDFGTPDDNTDLDATTGRHGLLPKLGGGTANFLRADGTWAAPAGGGGGEPSGGKNSDWLASLALGLTHTGTLPSYYAWASGDYASPYVSIVDNNYAMVQTIVSSNPCVDIIDLVTMTLADRTTLTANDGTAYFFAQTADYFWFVTGNGSDTKVRLHKVAKSDLTYTNLGQVGTWTSSTPYGWQGIAVTPSYLWFNYRDISGTAKITIADGTISTVASLGLGMGVYDGTWWYDFAYSATNAVKRNPSTGAVDSYPTCSMIAQGCWDAPICNAGYIYFAGYDGAVHKWSPVDATDDASFSPGAVPHRMVNAGRELWLSYSSGSYAASRVDTPLNFLDWNSRGLGSNGGAIIGATNDALIWLQDKVGSPFGFHLGKSYYR